MGGDRRDVVAVIPARAGSDRVKGKNTRPISGVPLVGRKIAQLKQSRLVTRIVVATNCEDCMTVARAEGVEVLPREDYFCDERVCSANEMILDVAQRIGGEHLVWAHCTNPFLYGRHYDAALEAFFAAERAGTADSLASVYKVQSHMWNADQRPANFNPKAPRHPLAATLDPVFFQDGGIFIQRRERFVETRYFYGDTPLLFDVAFPYCHDINTEEEFNMANVLAPWLDELELAKAAAE